MKQSRNRRHQQFKKKTKYHQNQEWNDENDDPSLLKTSTLNNSLPMNQYSFRKHGHGPQHRRQRVYENLEHLMHYADDVLDYMVIFKNQNTSPISINHLHTVLPHSKKLGRLASILEMHGLIQINQGVLTLTPEGLEMAQKIHQKRQVLRTTIHSHSKSLSYNQLEQILRDQLNEAELQRFYQTRYNHNAKSYPLNQFPLPVGIIHKLNFESPKYFYKLLSLGIIPGQRIKIDHANKTNRIITIKNTRFIIDSLLARQVYVVPL